MGHPEEGLIRAFLDGEAGSRSSTVEAHLRSCSECAGRVREQEETLAILAEGLSLADVPPALEGPSVRLLETPRVQSSRHGIGHLLRRNLTKAAAVAVLLSAGAAAALPGSPIHQWLTGLGGAAPEEISPVPETSSTEDLAEGTAAGREVEEVGTSVPVKAGGMTIRIGKMADRAELRVLLVQGDQASIFAGKGTRFRSEESVMEAWQAPGSVTVEIPMSAEVVEVLVDGTLFLRKEGERLDTPGPVLGRSQDEIRFGTAPGNPGG